MSVRSKIFTGILSAMIALLSCTTMISSHAAVEASIELGDANGDGEFDLSDAIYILEYLAGRVNPTARQVTAMDVNQDCVIDKTDSSAIQYLLVNNITPGTITKNLYELPDNSGRYYRKYDCVTKTTSTYYISSATNNYSSGILPISSDALAPDNRDNENINVVELTVNGVFLGSGFIVGSHVIATAAHCVYNSNGFVTGIDVNVYNANGEVKPSNLLVSAPAKSLHIPSLYLSYINGVENNYDYALIYVDKDLSPYGIWDIGIATTEFMNTNRTVVTSGFRHYNDDNNDILARYQKGGPVEPLPLDDHNYQRYRMYSLGTSYPGKSGGVAYYDSTYSTIFTRSALGVVTGAADIENGGPTYSVRITPTLIRFYKQNPYIE